MNSVSALLVVSFGTSYPETRARTIDAIEGALQDAFPGHRLYRAWTSGMIRKKLLSRDGERIPSVDEAMEQMALDGVTHVVVQPTHLLEGAEYDKVVNAVRAQADKFASVLVGAPLLAVPRDAEALAGALEEAFSHLRPDELLALMGHGSAHMGFPAYSALEAYFHRDGWANVAIGTVEFSPGIGPVLQQVGNLRPRRVILTPLLAVAGDHAQNDMAGDEEDSWKNQIARMGVQVECVVKGLGEYPAVRAIYVRHAQEAKPLN